MRTLPFCLALGRHTLHRSVLPRLLGNPRGPRDHLPTHLPHASRCSRDTWKGRGWRSSERSFSAVLCQGKKRECTPRLFNVFLMFLVERLFFDMLSLPTGANAARASWLAGCRLAHTRVPSFLRSLCIYATHPPCSEISTHALAQEKSQSPTKNKTLRRTRFLHVSVASRLVCGMTFILCLSGNPTPSGSSILD